MTGPSVRRCYCHRRRTTVTSPLDRNPQGLDIPSRFMVGTISFVQTGTGRCAAPVELKLTQKRPFTGGWQIFLETPHLGLPPHASPACT